MNCKKILAVLFCGALILSASACGGDKTSVPNNTESSTTSVQTTMDVKPYAMGKKSNANEKYKDEVLIYRSSYDTLYALDVNAPMQKAFQSFNAEKENNARLASQAEMFAEVESAYAENPQSFADGMYFTEESTVHVRRADEAMVSIMEEHYSYYGGVHPNSEYTAHTWNTKTGKEYTLSDLVQNPDSLVDVIINELHQSGKDEALYEEDMPGYLTRCIHEEADEYGTVQKLHWVMDHDGLTVFFNPYEIAPYAAGLIMVHLDVETYGDLYKDIEGLCSESYVLDCEYYDNEVPFVMQDWETNTNALYSKTYDNKLMDLPDISEASNCILVHTNGKDYLYLPCVNAQTKRSELRVFLWQNETATSVGTFDGTWMMQKSGDSTMTHLLTDLEDFILKSNDGTIAHYHVGADGMPVKNK